MVNRIMMNRFGMHNKIPKWFMKIFILSASIFALLSCNKDAGNKDTGLTAMEMKELLELREEKKISQGRFQLYTFPAYVNRSILLDTATGKIWIDNCYISQKDGGCEESAWTPQDVLGITITESVYHAYIDRLEKQKIKK